jgi:type IV pilus assembly protein PilQ
VTAAQGANGKIVVKVSLAKPLTDLPAAFTINTPPRIAFDFPATQNGVGKSTVELPEGNLRNVNIVQAGQRTRLVVNLNQMLSYDSSIDGNNLLITLQGKAQEGGSTPEKSGSLCRSQTGAKNSVRDIDFPGRKWRVASG